MMLCQELNDTRNSHKQPTEMGHSLDVLFDNTKMTNEMLTDLEKINANKLFWNKSCSV